MSASVRQRGMTLMEMIVSLSLLTVLLGGSVSLVMVASRAMTSEASRGAADAVVARSASDRIIDDLKVATAITEQTTRAITLTVPDRDGDGSQETIRYAWSGTAGDPLTRQYNSRAAATIATNVRALSFTYLSKTVGKPPPVEGDLETLFQHAASGAGVLASDVTTSKAVAAYFQPTLASKAVSWRIKSAAVQLSRDAITLGTVTFALYYADGNKGPTGAALQTSTATMASLTTSSAWVTTNFSAPADLDATKGVCLVVRYASGTGTVRVCYDSANADSRTAWLTSSDGGSSWGAASTASSMQLRLYGTVTTQEEETLDFQPLPEGP